MKHYRLLRLAVFSIVLSSSVVSAQQLSSVTTHRLYYLAKVWGLAKNFHPAIDGCDRNADSILIRLVPRVIASTSDSEFRAILDSVFTFAGPIPVTAGTAPTLGDRESRNIDTGWFADPMLGPTVSARLDTLYAAFRGDSNCYYGWNWNLTTSNPYFFLSNETIYSTGRISKPEFRFLIFFRYWNIIQYYYPYKYAMDRPWDSTLVDMMQRCMDVKTELDFHLFILRLQAKLNDAHGFTSSTLLPNYFGSNYVPFDITYTENKTVVRRVFDPSTGVKVGDVILSIDGVDIQKLRDSLAQYVNGSNPASFQRNLNYYLVASPSINATWVVDDGSGPRTVTFERSYTATQYSDSLLSIPGPVWKILPGNIGIVDMGRLYTDMVDSMYTDLQNTNGLIFDVRNYPNGTMYDVCDKIMPGPTEFVRFTYPDPYYPGSLYYQQPGYYCGLYPSNPDWYQKPVMILVNQETQSHAEFTVMSLQTHPFAMTIGSQTAGADGNVMLVELLPDLYVYFTSLGVYYPDWSETQRVGVRLDLRVTPTVNGMRAGQDEVLQRALELLSVPQTEARDASGARAYPNPFHSELRVALRQDIGSDAVVTVNDALGNQVLSRAVSSAERAAGELRINLPERTPVGVYWIGVRGSGVPMVVKAIRN